MRRAHSRMSGPACAARSRAPPAIKAPNRTIPKSPSSIDLLGDKIGFLRHRHLIQQRSEMRPARHERSTVSRQPQSHSLVLPQAAKFDSDSVPFDGENPQPVRAWAAGREFDGVKSTLTEVGSNPSLACRFRCDARRHGGSPFNIENHGENRVHGLN